VDKMDNRNGNPLTHKSYYNYCYFYDETNLKVVRKARKYNGNKT
jgi:hypothetical protein